MNHLQGGQLPPSAAEPDSPRGLLLFGLPVHLNTPAADLRQPMFLQSAED
jgi:hypothetical protein